MAEFKVLSKEIVGLKGAKYHKGDVVMSHYFALGATKPLESMGAIEKIAKKKS